MAVLKQVTGEPVGTLVDLKRDVTVIGRLPECDLILAPIGVSRRHAEIRKVETGFVVVDLDSRNKTLVNGTELKGGVAHLLKANDRISICGVEFVYEPAEPARTKAAAPAVEPTRAMDAGATADLMEVTEGDGGEAPDFVTLEAAPRARWSPRSVPR